MVNISIISSTALMLFLTMTPTLSQRPFYAGLRPIGYPETATVGLSRSFDSGRLPAQLNGDRQYAEKLDKLPIDQQPFWYINRDQIAENLKNPKTYPQRLSRFNDNNWI